MCGVSGLYLIHGIAFDFATDKIQRTFPWYKHIHALMGTSLIVDRSVVGNSSTPLNVNALRALQTSDEHHPTTKALVSLR